MLLPLLVALALACPSANAGKIDHFVVLMFENRAFDHILGHLRAINHNIDGLTGSESVPADPSVKGSPRVSVSFAAEPVIGSDPPHSFSHMTTDIYGGTNERMYPPPMNGFVKAAGNRVPMDCYNGTQVPVISALALEFGVCDRHFSSVPGPTNPNRLYFWSGTSIGQVVNDDDKYFIEGYPQRSFFTDVKEGGSSWGVYFSDFPDAGLMRDVRKHLLHLHHMDDFFKHCKRGTLPGYVNTEPAWTSFKDLWIESSEHPQASVTYGELYLKEVYEALRASPAWNRTALIITYDENGGLYDHVPPPARNVPNPDGINSTAAGNHFDFTRLGPRVPFVVVSPWVPRGQVWHGPPNGTTGFYDHTSTIKTARRMLNLTIQRPLGRREAAATSFEHFFSLEEPRTDCPETLRLSAEAQRHWNRWKLARATADTPRQWARMAPSRPSNNQRPLSDRTVDVCVGASAFDDAATRPTRAQIERWTQDQAGEYVRRMWLKWKRDYGAAAAAAATADR